MRAIGFVLIGMGTISIFTLESANDPFEQMGQGMGILFLIGFGSYLAWRGRKKATLTDKKDQ